MEDIFYCSNRTCSVTDIKSVALTVGFTAMYESESHLTMMSKNNETFEIASYSDHDMQEAFEKDDIEFINEYNNCSLWSISHHVSAVKSLIKLVEALFVELGGWASPDLDFRTNAYKLDTIDSFSYEGKDSGYK